MALTEITSKQVGKLCSATNGNRGKTNNRKRGLQPLVVVLLFLCVLLRGARVCDDVTGLCCQNLARGGFDENGAMCHCRLFGDSNRSAIRASSTHAVSVAAEFMMLSNK